MRFLLDRKIPFCFAEQCNARKPMVVIVVVRKETDIVFRCSNVLNLSMCSSHAAREREKRPTNKDDCMDSFFLFN